LNLVFPCFLLESLLCPISPYSLALLVSCANILLLGCIIYACSVFVLVARGETVSFIKVLPIGKSSICDDLGHLVVGEPESTDLKSVISVKNTSSICTMHIQNLEALSFQTRLMLWLIGYYQLERCQGFYKRRSQVQPCALSNGRQFVTIIEGICDIGAVERSNSRWSKV